MLNIKIIDKQYSQIFFTATFIFILICASTILHSKEDNFSVTNIKVEQKIDINFTRTAVIEKTFYLAFEKILKKVLQSKDYPKIKKVKLSEIKTLIKSFEITNEDFSKNNYKATFNVVFNKKNLSIFLGKKNILFSEPKKTKAIVFPVLDDGNDIFIFKENVFYKNWTNTENISANINYFLPIEEIDEFEEILKKNLEIEEINIDEIAKRYNLQNSVIIIMKLDQGILNTFLKLKFNNKIVYKNITYELQSSNDINLIQEIIYEIKNIHISDYWKSLNIIDFSSPLSIEVSLSNFSLQELKNFENTLKEIDIINDYAIKEFSLEKTIIKINYFSNPMRLKEKFYEFKYILSNESGLWIIKKEQ